jgi:hypothetical protein
MVTLFNDSGGWQRKGKKKSKRNKLYGEFVKEKVRHPHLSNKKVWRNVYGKCRKIKIRRN